VTALVVASFAFPFVLYVALRFFHPYLLNMKLS
jgi:hypothetical protein